MTKLVVPDFKWCPFANKCSFDQRSGGWKSVEVIFSWSMEEEELCRIEILQMEKIGTKFKKKIIIFNEFTN